MPIYPYKCVECGDEFNEIHLMKESPLKVKCGICGGIANRNWNAYGKTDEVMKRNVRRSWALGINPNNPKDVADAKARHPGAEFDKFGRMIIHNRVEKLKRMKEVEKAFGRELIEFNNRDI